MRFKVITQMAARNLAAGKYADGQGLWLVKRERYAGKWVLRLVLNGQRREMGLGRWPDVSIAEARDAPLSLDAASAKATTPLPSAARHACRLRENR